MKDSIGEKVLFELPAPVHLEMCLSVPRVAKHFGVPKRRVWGSCKSGEIPCFRIGTLYRVRLSQIPEAVVEKWKNPRAKWPEYSIPAGEVVYFITAANGPVKIGLSRDPVVRLARLNTASPIRLALVAVRSGGAELEREYHLRFAAHRLNGEWFNPHPDILAEIERIGPCASNTSSTKGFAR